MNNIVEQGTITLAIHQHIATIEFSHPKHNMLPTQTMQRLSDTITQAGQDDNVHVIILKSGGNRTFCSGASFEELMEVTTAEEGHQFFLGLAGIIKACKNCPKIIIGRIQGKAVGAGAGIAAAVDHCFGNQYAAVRLSELAIGIGPFVVGLPVAHKVGLSAYAQMALDANTWHSAQWAREKGLYTNVYDSTEEMDAAIETLAQSLSKSNVEAQTLIKKAIWKGTDHWEALLSERAAISGRLALSSYTENAIKAFKARAKVKVEA